MTTEASRMQMLERAEAEGWPALPEQPGGVRVPALEGEETWSSWAGIASREDMVVVSALLDAHKEARWRAEDSRGPVIDEALRAEHEEQARRDYEEYQRKRPERIEQLLERIALGIEARR